MLNSRSEPLHWFVQRGLSSSLLDCSDEPEVHRYSITSIIPVSAFVGQSSITVPTLLCEISTAKDDTGRRKAHNITAVQAFDSLRSVKQIGSARADMEGSFTLRDNSLLLVTHVLDGFVHRLDHPFIGATATDVGQRLGDLGV